MSKQRTESNAGAVVEQDRGNVVLLVDYENLWYGMQNEYRRQPDMEGILGWAGRRGHVIEATVYGDFQYRPLNQHLERLQTIGFQFNMVDARRWGPRGGAVADCADRALVDDLTRQAERLDPADTLILVSGDGGYASPMNWLSECTWTVVLSPAELLSNQLYEAAHETYTYEEVINPRLRPVKTAA